MTPRAAGIVVPILAGAFACSLAVDVGREQCGTDDDCRGDGFEAAAICVDHTCRRQKSFDAGDERPPIGEDPVWGCLGKVPPAPVEEKTPSVTVHAAFTDIITDQVVSGLSVKACAAADPSCVSPVAGTLTTSDEQGVVTMRLPRGFQGYMDVVSTEQMPALAFIRPVPGTTREEAPLERFPMMRASELTLATGSVGKSVKPEYGHAFLTALDCSRNYAANVIVATDVHTIDTFTYYTDSAGTPSVTQEKTTESGHLGYINLPPGEITFTLSLDSGRPIGREKVVIRAGTITAGRFAPTL